MRQTAFLLCIEANRLEPQGLMLCESIRRFAGAYANAPIFAVSPRPALAVGPSTRARLAELDVSYVVEDLNTTGSTYGTVNRVVAGAWAERCLDAEHLIVLDTDTVFLSAPDFDLNADVGVRPVDMKGSTSEGPQDPLDSYWVRMCSFGDIDIDDLPMIETSVDHRQIRASYNGGLVVVRRALGVLTRTRQIFFSSLEAGLRPWADRQVRVIASTGDVGLEAAQWWGSSQAALSVAIWASTRKVHIFDERYNIPLHLLAHARYTWPAMNGRRPVLAHYHDLAEAGRRRDLLTSLERISCPEDSLAWIQKRSSLFDEFPGPSN